MDKSRRKETAIAVDAMGGDLGPSEVVEAVKLAHHEIPDLGKLILVGDEAVLEPELKRLSLSTNPAIEIHHASEVIGMDEKPLQSIKRKRDSSIVRAIELVKQGEAAALISCGNTGALMAGGTIRLRTLAGVDRPALASVIPNQKKHFILIDAGANPESRPENLVHNAILGSIYSKIALGVESPRVGLLTIGTEEGKGNELTHQTHELLKRIDGIIDYSGPIEGFQVFDNWVDVVVCDGFVGNILLKTCESLFHTLKDYLTEELTRTPIRKLGALLAMGAFKEMKQQLNPDSYGGAPLLGLKGNILKAHGSSNRIAIMNAIRIGNEMIAHNMNEHILDEIAKANPLIESKEIPA